MEDTGSPAETVTCTVFILTSPPSVNAGDVTQLPDTLSAARTLVNEGIGYRDYLIENVSVKLPPAPRTYWPEISVAVTVIFMKP